MSKTSKDMVLNSNPGLITRLILYIGLAVFYTYGLIWCLVKRGSVKTTSDVLRVFYYDFLRLRREQVLIEKLTENELVTVSVNPCPILRLSLLLRVDTKYSCKLISETVCKAVLKRFNTKLVFKRDYNYIRPYSSGCREKIYFENSSTQTMEFYEKKKSSE